MVSGGILAVRTKCLFQRPANGAHGQSLLRWSRMLSAVEIKAINVGAYNKRNDGLGGPTLYLPLGNVSSGVINILSCHFA